MCEAGTSDCSFSKNCDTSQNNAEIICGKSVGGEPEEECECQEGGAYCADLELTGVTASAIDALTCMELCQSSIPCMFWKFNDANNYQKYCYLMGQDQCQAVDDNSCEHPICEGGHVGGDAGKPTCEAGTDNGPPTCPGPIVSYNDDEKKFYQKWRCFILSETMREMVSVDMYETDAKMPEGGFCKLATWRKVILIEYSLS